MCFYKFNEHILYTETSSDKNELLQAATEMEPCKADRNMLRLLKELMPENHFVMIPKYIIASDE